MSELTDALAVWGPIQDGSSARFQELLAQYKAQQDALWARAVPELRAQTQAANETAWHESLRQAGLPDAPKPSLWPYREDSTPEQLARLRRSDFAFLPDGVTIDDVNGTEEYRDLNKLAIGQWLTDNGFTDFTGIGSYRIDRPPRDQVTTPGVFWPLLTDAERAAGRVVLGRIAPGQLQEIDTNPPPPAPPAAPTATGSSAPIGTAPRQSPVSPTSPALPPSTTTGSTPGAPASGAGMTIGRAAPTSGATADGPAPGTPEPRPRAGEVAAGTAIGAGDVSPGKKAAKPEPVASSAAGAGEPSPGLEQLVLAVGAFLLFVGLAKPKGDS